MRTPETLKAIVIEDDVALANLLEHTLRASGYQVRTFRDPTVCPVFGDLGRDCPLSAACADVLITDVMMPNMNGLTLLRLQQCRGCKLLAANKALISATTSAEIQEAVADLGCHFFKKPFPLATLKDWLGECRRRLH